MQLPFTVVVGNLVCFRTQFEQENQLIYSELNSVADEVKQIEGKVVEISQLVDVFSEKILQQVQLTI